MKKDKEYYNVKIKNAVIALLTSTVLGFTSYGVTKEIERNKELKTSFNPKTTIEETNNNNYQSYNEVITNNQSTEVPATQNDFNKGDSIITTSKINLRLGTSKETFKLGTINKGEVVNRIISMNGFDLIRYDDKLVFVAGDYTDTYFEDYNNEYYSVEQYDDLVHTTTKVYFRLGPSKKEKDICLLNKDEELVVLGKSTSFTDSNDVWYLAKYQDKIGFVKAEYTTSLKDIIKSMDPSIENVEIQKIGYLTNDSYLYDNNNVAVNLFDAYQLVKILGEKDNYYVVEINNQIGLIEKNRIKTYSGNFVVVDLSDQQIFMYCNTDVVFKSYCTTGSDKTPTREGAFSVYERTNSRYFSKTAQAKYMWANFDNGNGLHDAPWEGQSKFGSEKYRKNKGSKGCVRLPDEAALFLKQYVKKGTKVLVKK